MTLPVGHRSEHQAIIIEPAKRKHIHTTHALDQMRLTRLQVVNHELITIRAARGQRGHMRAGGIYLRAFKDRRTEEIHNRNLNVGRHRIDSIQIQCGDGHANKTDTAEHTPHRCATGCF